MSDLFTTTQYNRFDVLLPGGGTKSFSFTPENSISMDRAKSEMTAFKFAEIGRITKMLGRPPADKEIMSGGVEAATDSRTYAEKYNDEHFSVRRTGEQTQMDRMIESQEQKLESERYKSLSRDEQRVEDMIEYKSKQEAESDSANTHAERLRKYADVIDRLKLKRESLAWNPEADEKDRRLVQQSLDILETEGSDLRQLTAHLQQIESREQERRLNREALLRQQQQSILEEMQATEANPADPWVVADAPAPEPTPPPAKPVQSEADKAADFERSKQMQMAAHDERAAKAQAAAADAQAQSAMATHRR